MDILIRLGPARGYFPEPSKSIYIGKPEHQAQAKATLSEFNFEYTDGARYIGSFIGSTESQQSWLQPKIDKWVENVKLLSKAARRFPQTAYAGLAKSLQMEWTYLQRVVPDVSAFFEPIEEAITSDFLPALLAGGMAETDEAFRNLTCFPVRYAGLGIPNPVKQAKRQYDTSLEMTEPVHRSLRFGTDLDALGYGSASKRLLAAKKKIHDADLEASLKPITDAAAQAARRRMVRSRTCGSWLTTMPDTINNTALTKEEFRDSLRIRYGLKPLHLPATCDGCHQDFSVGHALQCKTGGLIGQRHNDVAAEWHDLCANALTEGAVTDEPLIPDYPQGNPPANARARERPRELRGDIGVYGFWRRGTTAIFDVRVTDTDAATNRGTDPVKVLRQQEKEKKDKYLNACQEAHLGFTPLVYSVDGMEGAEASAARKHLASKLAAVWNCQYSQMCSFVKARLAFALVRATSRCLRGTRDKNIRPHSVLWVAGSGQRLYR